MLIIYNGTHDSGRIGGGKIEFQFCTDRNITLVERKGRQTLLAFLYDLLCRFLRYNFCFRWLNKSQIICATVNLRNRFQYRISILGRHRIKLAHTLLTIEVID